MANPVKIVQRIQAVNDQLADFIANGPSGGLRGWVRDRYRDRCNQFGNLPGWARALGGPAKHQMNAMCSPYWADNGWDGPVNPGPPYSGGQCDGVCYQISVTNESGANETIQARGPIGGVRGITIPGGGRLEIFARSEVNFSNSTSCLPLQAPGWVFGGLGGASWDASSNPRITNIAVVGGGDPNECGDPPDAPIAPGPNPPPNPGPLPGPEPTDDPRDPTGPPLLPIPPYEDPVFGPIPIEAPEDGPGGGGPPSGGDGLPGDPNAVGPSAGGAGGGQPGEDVDFGAAPAGRIWVGCVVEANVDPRYGTIPGTAPGNAVYPTTLGNASLIYDGFRGTSTRVLSQFTSLFRPVSSVVLTGCRVSSLPGVSLTVRPISAASCPENPCEETNG